MKTKERLNAQLYEKMLAEQERFKKHLMSMPPEEILNHTYEYTIREDILIWFDMNNLKPEQASAMLQSPCPLQDIYDDYLDLDISNMDTISDTIIARADSEAAKLREKARRHESQEMVR